MIRVTDKETGFVNYLTDVDRIVVTETGITVFYAGIGIAIKESREELERQIPALSKIDKYLLNIGIQ